MHHYCYATKDLHNAYARRELFQMAWKRVPESRLNFPSRIMDVLEVASSMFNGEIECRRQDYGVAFLLIRKAFKHEDNLMYAEP